MNAVDLINWKQCKDGKVPIVVVAEWPVCRGEIRGFYQAPMDDVQAILDLQIAYRKCRHHDGTGLLLDCDGDCIVCNAGLSQTELWKYSWPNEMLPIPEFKIYGCGNSFEFSELLPVIVQDVDSREILMFAWTDSDAFFKTWTTRQAHYFSRSRNQIWRKGEESGHIQDVHRISKIYIDQEIECLVFDVRQEGGACHDGYKSCFYRRIESGGSLTVVGERVFDPAEVYKN